MAQPEAARKRLHKELLALVHRPPPGIHIKDQQLDNIDVWLVDITGAPDTLYSGELFRLQFKFSPKYPFESPQVTFVGPNIPIHPHVYSNGHICLSILTDDWSPALNVASICLSVMSMLSSCKEKKLPVDNSIYIRTCSDNPKNSRFWYHDDKV